MPDTKRTLSALQTLLADNVIAGVTPQTLRDFLVSVFGASTLVTKTGAYLATTDDTGILADLTTGSFAITLPAASTMTGSFLRLTKIGSTSNILTITPNGTDKINGQSSITINKQYTSINLVSNGTNWYIQ
jgi:hypothetical protein